MALSETTPGGIAEGSGRQAVPVGAGGLLRALYSGKSSQLGAAGLQQEHGSVVLVSLVGAENLNSDELSFVELPGGCWAFRTAREGTRLGLSCSKTQ